MEFIAWKVRLKMADERQTYRSRVTREQFAVAHNCYKLRAPTLEISPSE